MRDQPVSQNDTGVKRRGLLRFGTLVTALTGASALSALGANSSQAATGDKSPPDSYVSVSEKGAPSGVATLDAASKILPAQLPDLSATYAGAAAAYADAIVVVASNALAGWDSPNSFTCTGVNDQAAIDSAVALAAAQGKRVQLSDGVFHWDAAIPAWTSGVSIKGAGKARTEIRVSPGPKAGPRFTGAKVSLADTGAFNTVSAGSREITTAINYTSSLARGNRVVIVSSKVFAERTYYQVGEWVTVNAVTPTTVRFTEALRHSYSSADTLRLYRMDLLKGVGMADLTVSSVETVADGLNLAVELAYCDEPIVQDVVVTGLKLADGLKLRECRQPQVRLWAHDIRGTEGYGVRTAGCIDAVIDIHGERNRHSFDDSALGWTPPSLRTNVRGVAIGDSSSGFSSHAGSDECDFSYTTAIGCGGGYVLRGRATKGRGMKVRGVHTDVFPGETAQTYTHAVLIGAMVQARGTIGLGGTGLDIEFDEISVGTPSNGASAIKIEYVDLVDSRIRFGRIDAGTDAQSLLLYPIHINADKIRRSSIAGGVLTIPEGNNQNPIRVTHAAVDGNNQIGFSVDNVEFNGFGANAVQIMGNSANTPENLSTQIAVRNCKMYPHPTKTPNILGLGNYFSTVIGALVVKGNQYPKGTKVYSTVNTVGIDTAGNYLSTGISA